MSVPDWMIDAPSPSVDDMATLIRRLVRSLRQAAPGHTLADQALDYLARVGMTGDVLRAPAEAPANEGRETALIVRDLLSRVAPTISTQYGDAEVRERSGKLLAVVTAGPHQPPMLGKLKELMRAAPQAAVGPMAKMAQALREKAAAERSDFDRRVQSGEWGPMPGPETEADDLPDHVAEIEGDDAVRELRWNKRIGAFNYPVGTKLYAAPSEAPANEGGEALTRAANYIDALGGDSKPYRIALAAPAQGDAKVLADAELLHWLESQLVDTIYLDDGRIIDVGTGRIGQTDVRVAPHALRDALRAARQSTPQGGK